MGGRAQKYYFIQYVPKYHQKLVSFTKILFYTICPKISSKTRMPGKWGGARKNIILYNMSQNIIKN